MVRRRRGSQRLHLAPKGWANAVACTISIGSAGPVSSDAGSLEPSGPAGFEGIAGWQPSHEEEVSVSHSHSIQGLLIAENAG
jgi:hypothetical protein